MPRTRGRPPRERTPELTDDEEEEEFVPPEIFIEEVQKKLKICKDFLSENYFDMCKELNKDLECSICMEKLNCRSCFMLLACGHSFHAKCLIRMQEHMCPTCRDHTH
jgi:hypothetical protein